MIVITGAAGFIGSALVAKLNEEKFYDLVLVDKFDTPEKKQNLEGKIFTEKVDREKLFNWLNNNHKLVQFIFHIGARTDTTEFDEELLDHLNLEYSKKVWDMAVRFGLPLIYASSAATYGGGEFGYKDDHSIIENLEPLNPYGVSKNEFDKWALKQEEKPYFWTGIKFFNVYGPNEYHKGRMASVVFHAFQQIKKEGKIRLFKSHNPDFKDGEQKRDFIYIKDVLDVLYWLMHHRQGQLNGIYNLGTGNAATFLDLAESVFNAMEKQPEIEFIDTPEDIRDKYQYFTEADMNKLREAGYDKPFADISAGADDYIRNFLLKEKYL